MDDAVFETDLDVAGWVELPRGDLEPRRWRRPDGTIISDAINHEAIQLLKTDPDEYFRRTRRTSK